MVDIATLGIAVDSSQVTKGAKDLDGLSNAAKRAQAAATGVSASTKNAGSAAVSLSASAGRAAASLNNEAVAAQKAAQAMRAHAAAANDNVASSGKFATANLAAQFQDIAVSAQAGASALQIGLQQGTQLAAVIATMEKPVQGLAAAFASVISPVSLLVIGMTALAAAGLQFIDWTKLGASLLRGLASVLETIAAYAAAAAAGLALLYSPAIIGGVVQLIALMGRLAVSAVGAAAAMAVANPATAFVLGVSAAVAAAVIFRDELARIFGRDIVGDAQNAANYVIAAFVGTFRAIEAVWNDLPDVLGNIAVQAAQTVIDWFVWMAREAVSIVNGLLSKINGMLRENGFTRQLSLLGNPSDVISRPEIPNPYANRGGSAMDAAREAFSGAFGQNYVGDFAAAVTRSASTAADSLRKLADQFGLDTEASKKAQKEAERLAARYADITLGARQFIAAQELEARTLGMTEQEANRLRYTQQLLNDAANDNIPLTAKQRAELEMLGAQMAAAETATSRLRDAYEFAKGTFQGFFEDIRSGLANGEGFWKSFGNAALNVLDRISQKMLELATNKLFDSFFMSSGGASGGILSSIASFLGFAEGGVFNRGHVTAFADGGVVSRPTVFPMASGMGLMGERGPEAIMPLRRGPDGRLGVAAAGGGVPQRLSIHVSLDNEMLRAVVKDESGRTVAQAAPQIVGTAVARANEHVMPTIARHQAQRGGEARAGL